MRRESTIRQRVSQMKPQTFSGQNQLQLQVRRPEGESGRRAEALDGGQWGS